MNRTGADHVARLAKTLAGPGIAVAATDAHERHPADPDESVAIARAVPARQREFHGGRAAARQAMAQLGLRRQPIPMGPDRAPVWPAGVVGSITHAKGICLAGVAPVEKWAMIGIDLEAAQALDADLVGEICDRKEHAWAATQPDPGLAAKRIFSAKEAAYKAQYPSSRAILGFDAMHVTMGASGRLSAEFRCDATPFRKGMTLRGRQSIEGGWLVTLVTMPG